MYSHCIFCSQHLGRNGIFETFPAGRVIAFDAWKGRLWAVCPRCQRWNLAPLEERWEAVESAEEQFRGTRLRMQFENIGVAQVPEGTQLIRVGAALPGELAAWRYGRALRGRRRTYWMNIALGVAAELAAPGAQAVRIRARRKAILYRLSEDVSPTGAAVLIRAESLKNARVRCGEGGEIHVSLPRVFSIRQRWLARLTRRELPDTLALSGRTAHDLLARAMVRVNAPGASKQDLRSALEWVERYGSPERILSQVTGGALTLSERRWSLRKGLEGTGANGTNSSHLPAPVMLAFEMALHEDSERLALAGDLRLLRECWREAEEIAQIADVLPADPLDHYARPGE